MPFINPVPTPIQPAYITYYKKACYGNNVEWYDSLGAISGLYKKCADANSCTLDACSAGKCSNAIKCDGTTCAVGSADYNTYCAASQPVAPTTCGNGLCEATLGETNANCPADCKINAGTGALSISFFAKPDSSSSQWQKTTEVGSNGYVYFMISATNASTTQIDNVSVSANIPAEIYSLGNLKLDGIAVSGDIVSGINIGSIAPQVTKLITFEGKTQTISAASTKQATATSSVSGVIQSDSVSISLNPSQATNVSAAVSSTASSSSGFLAFLKRWYLWIIAGLVLIFLFIIVFRRLSSNV
jgi:hypothetical protein